VGYLGSPMTEPCSAPAWTWGQARFWIDDSLNGLVAVSERSVAARGVGHVYVWGRPDGTLVLRFVPQAREADAWFDDDAGCLLLRAGDGRVEVVDLKTHAENVRDGAPGDPVFPAVMEDRPGTGVVTITWPDGHAIVRHSPHELVLKVASALAVGLVAVPPSRCVDDVPRRSLRRDRRRALFRLAEPARELTQTAADSPWPRWGDRSRTRDDGAGVPNPRRCISLVTPVMGDHRLGDSRTTPAIEGHHPADSRVTPMMGITTLLTRKSPW
jgi:hypothetical protein